jgi:hypothetical protein
MDVVFHMTVVRLKLMKSIAVLKFMQCSDQDGRTESGPIQHLNDIYSCQSCFLYDTNYYKTC